MTYIRSSIIRQPNGLWKATITSTWFYFGQAETHETFKTLQEARDWLLSQRCYNLHIEEEKLMIEQKTKTYRDVVYNDDGIPVKLP